MHSPFPFFNLWIKIAFLFQNFIFYWWKAKHFLVVLLKVLLSEEFEKLILAWSFHCKTLTHNFRSSFNYFTPRLRSFRKRTIQTHYGNFLFNSTKFFEKQFFLFWIKLCWFFCWGEVLILNLTILCCFFFWTSFCTSFSFFKKTDTLLFMSLGFQFQLFQKSDWVGDLSITVILSAFHFCQDLVHQTEPFPDILFLWCQRFFFYLKKLIVIFSKTMVSLRKFLFRSRCKDILQFIKRLIMLLRWNFFGTYPWFSFR